MKIKNFLGEKDINIAGFQLGRKEIGVLFHLAKLPNVTSAKYLTFR